MLHLRVMAATVITLVLSIALCVDYYLLADSWCLHLIALVGTFLCFREFWPLCRETGSQTFSDWGTFSGTALVVAHYWTLRVATPHSFHAMHQASNILNGAMAFAVLGTFFLTARRHDLPASLNGLGVTCLGLIYIWFLPSFVMKLRHLGTDGYIGGEDWNHFGTKLVIATIVIAKGCDIGAYFVGRKFGQRKAFPQVSPGKTIAGVIGGLGMSCLLAMLLSTSWLNVLPSMHFSGLGVLLFGLLVGFSGMMGDLAESLLKRSAGVKDASHIVPGYGGVMDVIDSLVIAGPVAYFLVPFLLK